jgi:hypothetical protein
MQILPDENAGRRSEPARPFSDPRWRKVQQGLLLVILSLMGRIVITALFAVLLALGLPAAVVVALPSFSLALRMVSLLGKCLCLAAPKIYLRIPLAGACIAITCSWLATLDERWRAGVDAQPGIVSTAAIWGWNPGRLAVVAEVAGMAVFLYFVSGIAELSGDQKLIRQAKRLLTISVAIVLLGGYFALRTPASLDLHSRPLEVTSSIALALSLLAGAVVWLWWYVRLLSRLGERIGDDQQR